MIALNIPLLAWIIVACTMAALIVTRLLVYACRKSSHKIKFLGIAAESEELFVPGDRELSDKDYSDDDLD